MRDLVELLECLFCVLACFFLEITVLVRGVRAFRQQKDQQAFLRGQEKEAARAKAEKEGEGKRRRRCAGRKDVQRLEEKRAKAQGVERSNR